MKVLRGRVDGISSSSNIDTNGKDAKCPECEEQPRYSVDESGGTPGIFTIWCSRASCNWTHTEPMRVLLDDCGPTENVIKTAIRRWGKKAIAEHVKAEADRPKPETWRDREPLF